MDYYDLISISTRNMAIMNPTTPEKLRRAGEMAGLAPGEEVIEFGCGYGTVLTTLARGFGIQGRGIDLREYACQRAVEQIAAEGYAELLTVTCADVLDETPDHAYDLAACIGSTHIWGGLAPALEAMAAWLTPDGRMIVGERCWQHAAVPPDFARAWPSVLTEYEIFECARDAGYEMRGVLHATADDWDTYESGNWGGLLAWLHEHPDDKEAKGVREYLHQIQDEFAGYGREYMGFGLYVLVPV